MQRITHANGVITYSFATLGNLPVRAHVATRHGGVSPAPWNTLNFSVLRGDTPERVQQNWQRLGDALELPATQMVHCRQMHGTGVAKVDGENAGEWIEETDALITDELNLGLALLFADCVPVLLYDRLRHVLGVCHAGWRGTVNGIAASTLWAMQAAHDTNPADVLVAIGPSIGPQSYEVGQEVVDLAQMKLPNADDLFSWPNGPDHNPYFDLWRANASQLAAAGVPPSQIEIGGVDTAQSTADFFSHRAEQGKCGLFSMVAWLL